ncbi:RNA-dependent RNA polymerase [Gregarina niphandrodes]|uniref:RNA-dependent RNA polymerase n=1 Tax=Gregarina niphandrodes TaxID=110365 RepID=A0A023B7X2_GRENI|nr:RNA-dependent RNA polymerase [Gregarina niphandrodes]EZG67978.1 RNA-dependent RNA polymerase [Gregarina niphandrodes]|eukprot:XP_011130127.1 RNA-dependent RNA polymerase [Gregarina niphandrodes]
MWRTGRDFGSHKFQLKDVNGYVYECESDRDWPNGTVTRHSTWYDYEYFKKTFTEGTFDCLIAGRSLISAAEVQACLSQIACVKNVIDKRYDKKDSVLKEISIHLFSIEMRLAFFHNMKFTTRTGKEFDLKFEGTSRYDESRDTYRALFAENMIFSSHIRTELLKNIPKKKARMISERKLGKDDLIQTVEIYPGSLLHNNMMAGPLTGRMVFDPTLVPAGGNSLPDNGRTGPSARWDYLVGFLLPSGSQLKYRFGIMYYHNRMEIYGQLLTYDIKPYKITERTTANYLKSPIKFVVYHWHLISSPSVAIPYNSFLDIRQREFLDQAHVNEMADRLTEPLLFSFHCHSAFQVFRYGNHEDKEREKDEEFSVHIDSNLFLPTFVHHDYATRSGPHRTKKVDGSWPIERALANTMLKSTGMTFLIRLLPTAGTRFDVTRWSMDKIGDILSHLSYYRIWKPRRAGIRSADDARGAAKVIRLVLPVENTELKTQEYFTLLWKRRVNYLCYGAMVQLVQNGWYPKRYIADYMDRQRTTKKSSRALAADLMSGKYQDPIMYSALITLCQCAKRKGRLTNIRKTYDDALSQAFHFQHPLPVTTADTVTLYHAYIMPSRTCIMGPYTESSNRVLRKYIDSLHQFMRATFVDTEGQRSHYNRFDERLLSHKLNMTFQTGFPFGCHTFEYLAYGNSQLKECSFWAFSEDATTKLDGGLKKDEEVLRELGTVKDKFIGKRAARLGQCFTASKQGLVVKEDKRMIEPDVCTPVRLNSASTFCFTDGIGRMGRNVASEITRELGLKLQTSAVQIRYKGHKGMLVFDPYMKNPDYIAFRESQKKFESAAVSLEICEWSRPISLQLNKDLILLLSTWNVPDSAFLNLLKEEQDSLVGLFQSRRNALSFLFTPRLQSATAISNLLMWLIRTGFDPLTSPFMTSCLRHLRRWIWRDDLHEFRLACPKGAQAFGVNDNTGILKYDNGIGMPQVFLQISHRSRHTLMQSELGFKTALNYRLDDELDEEGSRNTDCWVIKGHVLVSKSPSHDPGDIIVCEAIDDPGLYHLVDVVVFPGPGPIVHPRHPGNGDHSYYRSRGTTYNGPRDIPNMMSGGDLDGDMFQIIWEPSIVKPAAKKFLDCPDECPHPPGDYTIPFTAGERPTVISELIDANSEIKKIETPQEWFVHYHRYDNLSLLSVRWLYKMLDSSVYRGLKGRHPECLDLAARASLSVDFAKQGTTAKMPKGKSPCLPYFLVSEMSGRERRFQELNYDCKDSILGKIWETMEDCQRPYVSDSCCIITHEGFYRDTEDGSLAKILAYAHNGYYGGITNYTNLSTTLHNTVSIEDYGPDNSDHAPLHSLPVYIRRPGRAAVCWKNVSDIWCLCRIDFETISPHDPLDFELFAITTEPHYHARRRVTLVSQTLTPPLEESTSDTQTDLRPCILHKSYGSFAVMGIKLKMKQRHLNYLIKSFRIVVKTKVNDASRIIGVSNDIDLGYDGEIPKCWDRRPAYKHLRNIPRSLLYVHYLERYEKTNTFQA